MTIETVLLVVSIFALIGVVTVWALVTENSVMKHGVSTKKQIKN